jgi:hypothetical protein
MTAVCVVAFAVVVVTGAGVADMTQRPLTHDSVGEVHAAPCAAVAHAQPSDPACANTQSLR